MGYLLVTCVSKMFEKWVHLLCRVEVDDAANALDASFDVQIEYHDEEKIYFRTFFQYRAVIKDKNLDSFS